MGGENLTARIDDEIREMETLIAEMEEERRLLAVQLAQMRSVLIRLRAVQSGLGTPPPPLD